MGYYENSIYKQDIANIVRNLPEKNYSYLITGASGLIGSVVADCLICANEYYGRKNKFFLVGRNYEFMKKRFERGVQGLKIICGDIVRPINVEEHIDYILHFASNADPKMYLNDSVGTILTNIVGTKNIIDVAQKNCSKLLLASTFEVYGSIDRKAEFSENDFGYIDNTMLRNCYPESKRCAEMLCRGSSINNGFECVIVRYGSIFGPGMKKDDSKAHAQFIRNGLARENIVLKSLGLQKRSYMYVMDAVDATFAVLFKGHSGEAYNISNENIVASVADVANAVANISDTKVVYEEATNVEKNSYSKPNDCILNNCKLKRLGWTGKYDLVCGLKHTIEALKEGT